MAKVTEEFIPYERDEDGNVTTEIKVFVVKEGDQTVGRFFPEVSTEKEVKTRADAFAKNFKLAVENKPDYITQKVKKSK